MGFIESLYVALFCMLFVFTMLAILFVVIKVFSYGVKQFEATKVTAEAPR